jgi:large subunit ribosomal protein L7/L12
MENTMSSNVQSLVEKIGSLTVLELAELTKALEEKFGVSAAMPMAHGAVASAAPAQVQEAKKEEEKSEFKVELLESGTDKIKVIKALRKVKKDLGLTEAKKMAEETPVVVADGISKADADMMKSELEAAGAKVKLS